MYIKKGVNREFIVGALMVKFLIFIVFIIAVFACCQVVRKIKINDAFKSKYFAKLNSVKVSMTKASTHTSEEIVEVVDEYEQQLFDDVAAIFLASKTHEMKKEQAVNIQEYVLNKMPIQTQTSLRNLDLEEWSIYWGFYHQSLEYYVGRYGVFITHVDRDGLEHQYSYRISE